jgi:hypothetical protein
VTGTGLELGLLFRKLVCSLPGFASIDGRRLGNQASEALEIFYEYLGLCPHLVENGPPGRLPFPGMKINKIKKEVSHPVAVALADRLELIAQGVCGNLLATDAIEVTRGRARGAGRPYRGG